MNRAWLIVLMLICSGCGPAPKADLPEEPPAPVATDFSRLSQILSGIDKSAILWLYEGLPGDFWEPELREQELRQKATVWIEGYPAYDDSPTVADADASALTELLSTPASYKPLGSGKKCGGFQLEYCVE